MLHAEIFLKIVEILKWNFALFCILFDCMFKTVTNQSHIRSCETATDTEVTDTPEKVCLISFHVRNDNFDLSYNITMITLHS